MAAAAINNNTPSWKVSGDWFDVCKCNIPCPYGETILDGLNVLISDSFNGNIWAGDGKTKLNVAIFFDEKANEQQREALNMIFSGKAGGFLGELFAKIIGEVRGIEYVPIKFEVADDLSFWSAEIPEKVVAKAEALAGPMTPLGKSPNY